MSSIACSQQRMPQVLCYVNYLPGLCVHWVTAHFAAQVLGRNLEALVTRAQDIKADWRDEFVSVEHMLLAFLDDAKFGTNLLKGANLDKAKLEAAVKEIRGSNRVTDQVIALCMHHMLLQLLVTDVEFALTRCLSAVLELAHIQHDTLHMQVACIAQKLCLLSCVCKVYAFLSNTCIEGTA